MAIIQKRASDISGTEAPEQDFATLIVRQHPKAGEAKKLDVLPVEIEQLKPLGDLVVIEVRMPDTTTRELYVRYQDFAKLVSDEVVNAAPGTRGRQPGYRPNGNGG